LELINLSKKIDDAVDYSLGAGRRFKTSIEIMQYNTYTVVDSTVDSTSHTLVLGVGGKSRLKVTLPKNLGLYKYVRDYNGQEYPLPSDVFSYYGGCPILGNVFNRLSFGDFVLGRIVFDFTKYCQCFVQDYAGYPVDYTLLPRLKRKSVYEIFRTVDRHTVFYTRFITHLRIEDSSPYSDAYVSYMLSDCGTASDLGGCLAREATVSLELEPH